MPAQQTSEGRNSEIAIGNLLIAQALPGRLDVCDVAFYFSVLLSFHYWFKDAYPGNLDVIVLVHGRYFESI
jgi:hypothetical protein